MANLLEDPQLKIVIIFMFLGIDDSLSVALKYDPELVSFADKKRIALVSPSILHISIKMVENLWRLDGQRESVIKVYEEAQKLVDKLHGFTNVMDSLGTSIAQSQKKYDDARNKLIDGKGSMSSKIEGLVALGSKETKKLIIITRGEKGAIAINKNEIEECSAKENLQIKDLTGAGDLFAGGFLHGLINNKSTK